MVGLRDLTEKICQTLDIHDPVKNAAHLDKMTFEEWILENGGGKTGLASATVWTRAMLGMEPREMSALFFLNYCKSGGGLLTMRSDRKNGGQYLRFVKGNLTPQLPPSILVVPWLTGATRNSESIPWNLRYASPRGSIAR